MLDIRSTAAHDRSVMTPPGVGLARVRQVRIADLRLPGNPQVQPMTGLGRARRPQILDFSPTLRCADDAMVPRLVIFAGATDIDR